MPFDMSTARDIDEQPSATPIETPSDPALMTPPKAVSKFDLSTAKELPSQDQHTYRETTRQVVAAPQGLAPDELEFLDDTQNQAKPRSSFYGYVDMGANFAKDFAEGTIEFVNNLMVQAPAAAVIETGERLQEAQDAIPPLDFTKAGFSDIYNHFKRQKEQGLAGSVSQMVDRGTPAKIVAAGQRVQAANKAMLKEYGIDSEGLAADLGSGVGSVGTAVALTVATRNPLYAAALFGGLQKTQIYQESRAAGKTPSEASTISNSSGLMEAGIEALGGKVFLALGNQSKRLNRILSRVVEESAQEGLQQSSESAITNVTDVRDQTGMQIAKDVGYSMMIGALTSAPVSVVADYAETRGRAAGLPEGAGRKIGEKLHAQQEQIVDAIAKEIENGVAPLANDKTDEAAAVKIIKAYQEGKPIALEHLPETVRAQARELGIGLPEVAPEQAAIVETSLAPESTKATPVDVLKYDNPGGDWLEVKRRNAEEDYAKGQKVSGPITAYVHQTNLPTDFLATVPGSRGEARSPGESQYDALAEKVDKEGFSTDAPILVGINHRGEPYVIEGNTRIAVAKNKGIQSIPATVRYFSGGELVDGPLTPDILNRLSQSDQSSSSPDSSEPPITPPTDLSGPAEPPEPSRAWTPEDYAVNRAKQREARITLWDKTKNFFGGISDGASDIFVPISTRLGQIDQRLKHEARKFTFNVGLFSERDKIALEPFANKASQMSEDDYLDFDAALKNRDADKVSELVTKYDIQAEYDAARAVLDDLFAQAEEVGIEMGYVSDYFPRKVRPDKVGEYIAAIQQKTEWSQIEQDMHRADPDNAFTEEEKAHFVNNWLRGYVPNKTTLARPDNTKERKVDIIDPSLNMYYQDSIPTLLSYVGKMRHIIEAKKFFGLSASNPEAGIGTLVGDLVAQGKISPDQEVILKRLLRAVVQPQGVGSTAATWKNVGYIYTMGSPASAVTQLGDLAFSFHKNGFYRTMKGLTKSVVGQQEFKKEHIGIGNIAQEFEDSSTSSRAVQKVFKAIGIQFTDNVGKETYMGAAYDRLRSAAKKNGQQFKDQLSIIFGDQADQVHRDLITDNRTDDVLYLVASELYDVQPVSITEMPIGYARGGTNRIWYMLKSYTIKQIDTYRREILTEIGSGEPKRVVKGLKNLVTLSAWMFLMGASSDFLKNLMLGRETEREDLIYDNALKLAGISKFQIYRAEEAGVIESFVPPLLAPVVDVGGDIAGVLTDDKDIKDLETWGHIPVLGKLYYWWYGAGAEKE